MAKKHNLVMSRCDRVFSLRGNIGEENTWTINFETLKIEHASNWKNPFNLIGIGGSQVHLTKDEAQFVCSEFLRLSE